LNIAKATYFGENNQIQQTNFRYCPGKSFEQLMEQQLILDTCFKAYLHFQTWSKVCNYQYLQTQYAQFRQLKWLQNAF